MRSLTPPGFESWPFHAQATWFADESRRYADKTARLSRICIWLAVVSVSLAGAVLAMIVWGL